MVRALNIQDSVITGGAHALMGGAQRVAWENEQVGMLATGLSILGGMMGQTMFAPNDMLHTLSRAAFNSGASVAGWIMAERTFGYAGTGNGAGAGRLTGGRRRALNGPSSRGQGGTNTHNPEVSLAGINPNTGERIYGSRV